MVKVRFERGRDDVIGPTYGPYDYVQLTYESLRIPMNDGLDDILAVKHIDGDWYINNDFEHVDENYSDVVIFDSPP